MTVQGTLKKTANNYDLGTTIISDKIYVSSAAILYPYERWGQGRWQVETWIFSEDHNQKSRHIIHGSNSVQCKSPENWTQPEPSKPPHKMLCKRAWKVHDYIVNNLKSKYM